MIARAKAHEELMDSKGLDEFVKEINKSALPKIKQRVPLKKSRKDITKHDIEIIEALGGSIEDLLK